MEYDFRKLRNQTVDVIEKWNTWQEKILKSYNHLFREISSGNIISLLTKFVFRKLFYHTDFLRAVAIIRAKNPTRGSKRVRNEDASKHNPMNGLIKWIKVNNKRNKQLKEMSRICSFLI